MISVERYLNRYKVRVSEPGTGLRGWKTIVDTPHEAALCVEHYYGDHSMLKREDCPYCQGAASEGRPSRSRQETRP